MLRAAFVLVVAAHGLLHLLGFCKASGLAALPRLTVPIGRGLGGLWLTAAVLLLASAIALPLWPRGWWAIGGLALLASQIAIATSWSDARFGTLANVVLLLGVVHGVASRGPWSLRADYERGVALTGRATPAPVLQEADLAGLPDPVRRYVRRSGAVGLPRVHDLRATWTGRIRAGADRPWMAFTAEQRSTFDPPRRFFRMDATMKGLPVDVLHAFDERGATMRVRVLSLYPMVDARGQELTRAETVTLLNDLCILAPGALVSPLIAWEPIDAHRARARFTLRGNAVAAELLFNDQAELVDFTSDDRAAATDGGGFTPMRWTTPLGAYATFGPVRVATHGETVWHPESGAWTYGEFTLTSLAYNASD